LFGLKKFIIKKTHRFFKKFFNMPPPPPPPPILHLIESRFHIISCANAPGLSESLLGLSLIFLCCLPQFFEDYRASFLMV
jgi:hypothetical protein